MTRGGPEPDAARERRRAGLPGSGTLPPRGGAAGRRDRGGDSGRPDPAAGRTAWLFAPPPFLDPLLAFAERVERRRRHIRPVTLDGLVAVEQGPHHGEPVVLRDGTHVRPGDPLVLLHFRNEHIRTEAGHGWNAGGWRRIRRELSIVAAWGARLPEDRQPIAYRGTTLLDTLLRREGWLVRPRPRTFVNRVEDWFMRWLLVHWSRGGRSRLEDGRRLESVDGWLSRAEFEARYAAPSDGARVGEQRGRGAEGPAPTPDGQ